MAWGLRLAGAVRITKSRFAGADVPVPAAQSDRGSQAAGMVEQDAADVRRLRADGDRNVWLHDPGLFPGDDVHRRSQQFAVVERDGGNGAGGRGTDDVRGIAASAEADFQNAQIGRRFGEQIECGGGDHLEYGDRSIVVDPFDPLHLGDQAVVRDQCAGDADAFVETDQMRRGIDVDALARGFGHGSDEGAGAAFAVGARHVNDRRQATFGMVEASEQNAEAVEAEVDQPGVQALEAGGDLFDSVVHAAA